jgi:hypothetical protein
MSLLDLKYMRAHIQELVSLKTFGQVFGNGGFPG